METASAKGMKGSMVEKTNKYGWKTTASKQIYQNPWISVREDSIVYPNGQAGIYGVVEKGPGVAVVALDENKNIFLVKQYRYTKDYVFLEIPAGAVHQRESELDCAKRELFEEIGIKAVSFERLGNFYTALGHETAEIIVYLATGFESDGHSISNQKHDESILEIVRLPVSQAKQIMAQGQIKCGITLASLNLFFLKYPDL
jgi:ADP-ribose pyrophosphatase